MTAMSYPDLQAESESGRFILEARSPHNGTVPHRDGRMASEDEYGYKYRDHQGEFRYRLLEDAGRGTPGRIHPTADPVLLWERFQGPEEDSPHELLASDDGWSIIRTHGFGPEVIAVGSDGREIVRIRIVAADRRDDEEGRGRRPPGPVWPLNRLVESTAGNFWSAHSWPGFFRHREATVFAWRAASGQRLVLDLGRAVAYTDERLPPDELAGAVVEAEKAGVRALLGRLSRRMDEVHALLERPGEAGLAERDPLRRDLSRASGALHLAGVHRLHDCVPFLRDWEGLDVPWCSKASSATPIWWSCRSQLFRPIVHHALKRLGEEPQGLPAYDFTKGEGASRVRFPLPERLPDRRERAKRLRRSMSWKAVLRLLGSPDFIRRRPRKIGPIFFWPEDWEYDFRSEKGWTTLRLTWALGFLRGCVTAIEEVGPYWLDSDEREIEFLQL